MPKPIKSKRWRARLGRSWKSGEPILERLDFVCLMSRRQVREFVRRRYAMQRKEKVFVKLGRKEAEGITVC